MKAHLARRPPFVRPLLSILGLLVATASWSQYAGSAPPPQHLAPGFKEITEARAKEWLGYLAGPECQGRGTGQDGFQKAAEYVAARFREFGLKPVGDGGTFFQGVPFLRSRVDSQATYLGVGDDVKLRNIRIQSTASDANLSADVVFLKLTGANPTLAAPAELQGKIVVVANELDLKGDSVPATTLVSSGSQSGGGWRQQVARARPTAVFTVVNKLSPLAPSSIRPAGRGGRFGGGTPRAEIALTDAVALAKAVGVDEEMLKFNGGTTDGAVTASGSKQATFVAKVIEEEVRVPNVVGLLEGSDPTLKAEVVGIGSHLDHLGSVNGRVYWGADDDGSGTTAVLLIAKAMSANPQKPKRSVLFMTFCGEEMGLVGSRHYAENPLIPNEKMICELQLDMVGRNEEKQNEPASDNTRTIHLVGSKRISTQLHELVLESNKHVNFEFEYDEEGVYTRSDHYSFAAKGIPIAFLFTGFHPDYHQPSDTVDKINFEKITNAARLFYLTGWQAANRLTAFPKDVPPSGGGGG